MNQSKLKHLIVLVFWGMLVSSFAVEPATQIETPLFLAIDEARVPTSLTIKIPFVPIGKPLLDWTREKHASPDDAAFQGILVAIQNKAGGELKTLVVNSPRSSVEDENVFVESLNQALYRKNYNPVLLGKTSTATGVLYSIEMVGEKPYLAPFFLARTGVNGSEFLWDMRPESPADSFLQGTFDPRGTKLLQGAGRPFDSKYLAEVLLQNLVLDPAETQKVQECIKLFVQSEMGEGVTAGSRVQEERSLQVIGGNKQKNLESFLAQYQKLKFLINLHPLYIGFFETEQGMEHLYFTKKEEKFVLTNLNKRDEIYDVFREFVSRNKTLKDQIFARMEKAAGEPQLP